MNKYTEDFTTISTEITEKITKAVAELNCKPVLICKLNNYPEDDYLYAVIGQYIKSNPLGEYCVWTANTNRPIEMADLCHGHYGVSFKSALQIINNKIRDLNKEEN